MQNLHRTHLGQVAAVVGVVAMGLVLFWTGACSGKERQSATRQESVRMYDHPEGKLPAPRILPAPRNRPVMRRPVLRWRFDSGFPITAPPLVHGQAVVFGSTDGSVYALRRATGEVVWRTRLGSAVDGPPVVLGDQLHVGLRDGRLVRLRPDSGEVIWTAHTGARIRHASAGQGGLVVVGNDRGHVVAVDQRSGAEVWRHKTGRVRIPSVKGGYDSVGISGGPVVDQGVVFVGSLDTHIQALDLATGRLRWRFRTLGPVTTPVVVAPSHVFVAGPDGYVYSVRRKTGKLQWRVELSAQQSPTNLALHQDILYVTGKCRMVALQRSTGLVVWRYAYPGCSHAPPPSAPVPGAIGRLLNVPVGRGKIHTLQIPTGRRLWILDIGHQALTSPAVAPEGLYVGSHDGALYALGPAAPGSKDPKGVRQSP